MKINLFDLPPEGKDYEFTQTSGQLNSVLADLLGKNPYNIQLNIRPINSRDFQLSGKIDTGSSEQCSRCGIDFPFLLKEILNEILIPSQKDEDQGSYARVNHVSDFKDESSLEVCYYNRQGTFDLGEYIHEQIALAIPFNPAPSLDDEENCNFCLKSVKATSFSYEDPMTPNLNESKPFAVLKDLKL